MSQFTREREEKVRAGSRLLVAAAVVPVTLIATSYGQVAGVVARLQESASPHRPTSVLFNLIVVALATMVIATIALMLALLAKKGWRFAAAGAWAGSVAVLLLLSALPLHDNWPVGIMLPGLEAAMVLGILWMLRARDPPPVQ